MRFRLFGIETYVSVPFAVIIAFLLIADRTGFMSASLFAVAVHEAGHIAAMKFCRTAPGSISLRPSGILICGSAYCTAGESLLVAASGPMANVLFAGIFYFSGRISDSMLMYSFAAVQLLIGTVNLLPVKGLDGGTLLGILLNILPINNAGFFCSFISVFTATVMTVAGAAIAVKNVTNPSLLLLGLYLIILNLMKT